MDLLIPFFGGFMVTEADGDAKYQFSLKEGQWEGVYECNPSTIQKVVLFARTAVDVVLGIFG